MYILSSYVIYITIATIYNYILYTYIKLSYSLSISVMATMIILMG